MTTHRARPDVTESEVFGSTAKRAIHIVAHDPSWPARFEVQRARIQKAMGSRALQVEHIGSTAVPGLSAKPVIDILVTVDDITDEDRYVQPLVAEGYELRRREPGHRLLRTPERDVNIHVLEPTSPAATNYLVLRDQLRRDPEDRRRYQEVKEVLARRDWPGVSAYADAKTEIITEIMERAGATDRAPW